MWATYLILTSVSVACLRGMPESRGHVLNAMLLKTNLLSCVRLVNDQRSMTFTVGEGTGNGEANQMSFCIHQAPTYWF